MHHQPGHRALLFPRLSPPAQSVRCCGRMGSREAAGQPAMSSLPRPASPPPLQTAYNRAAGPRPHHKQPARRPRAPCTHLDVAGKPRHDFLGGGMRQAAEHCTGESVQGNTGGAS